MSADLSSVAVVLDCGCAASFWRERAVVGHKVACVRHSPRIGPHPEDGLDVLLADRTIVSVAPASPVGVEEQQ